MGVSHTYHSTEGKGAKEAGGNRENIGDSTTIPHGGQLVRQSSAALDPVGRGSVVLAVGPRRRKDKNNYSEPQAEVEDNVDHGTRQRGTRH
jgi:hypothetical protein